MYRAAEGVPLSELFIFEFVLLIADEMTFLPLDMISVLHRSLMGTTD